MRVMYAHAALQTDREYCVVHKHLIYYRHPDAPVHMVTTNVRFYIDDTHLPLTHAKVSHLRFSVGRCVCELLNGENPVQAKGSPIWKIVPQENNLLYSINN